MKGGERSSRLLGPWGSALWLHSRGNPLAMAGFPILRAAIEVRPYNILFCSGYAEQVIKMSASAQAPLWAEWRASCFQDKKGWIAQPEEGLPYTQEV